MMSIPNTGDHSVFVQIGLTALRDEDGTFLPAVPLFVQVPEKEINRFGQSPGEEELTGNITEILAEKFGKYIQGIQALERQQKQKGVQ